MYSNKSIWGSFFFSFKIYGDATVIYQRNLINAFGMLIVSFAVLVLYIVGHPGYQRPADGEIQHVPFMN